MRPARHVTGLRERSEALRLRRIGRRSQADAGRFEAVAADSGALTRGLMRGPQSVPGYGGAGAVIMTIGWLVYMAGFVGMLLTPFVWLADRVARGVRRGCSRGDLPA